MKRIRIVDIIITVAMISIILSGVQKFKMYNDNYNISLNLGTIIIAAVVIIAQLLSFFKNWDIAHINYYTEEDKNIQSDFAFKKKELINHIQSLSIKEARSEKEKELNEMIRISISKIEGGIDTLEDALEDYYKNISN